MVQIHNNSKTVGCLCCCVLCFVSFGCWLLLAVAAVLQLFGDTSTSTTSPSLKVASHALQLQFLAGVFFINLARRGRRRRRLTRRANDQWPKRALGRNNIPALLSPQ